MTFFLGRLIWLIYLTLWAGPFWFAAYSLGLAFHAARWGWTDGAKEAAVLWKVDRRER